MVEEISAKELWDRLQEGENVQIVDIREPGEYKAGHIPGAENLPLNHLQDRFQDREWKDEIVVACYQGNTSPPAARFLESALGDGDRRFYSLEDGCEEWPYEWEE